MEKNLRFQQIRVISNSGIFKYVFVLYFFYGRITLSIGSTGLPTEHKNV